MVCDEEGEGSGEGIAGADALGALQEFGHEGRDLGEEEAELEAREEREDQADQEEGPCGCAGAVPAAACVGGAVVFQEDDQEGEKGWEEVEREGAVDEDHEEAPDHHEDPLPEACDGRLCDDCCGFEPVVPDKSFMSWLGA